ncbi:unnamed protein product [Protopolystoma xenopodis]|uniref:Uncharacterized protein n=1 Tax=Protopolystoma xenopodis TaxID=117903 RepID=A0A3S5AEC1_9PLAT|nr:unnamed protein product [Protopolystoma xenopodis]
MIMLAGGREDNGGDMQLTDRVIALDPLSLLTDHMHNPSFSSTCAISTSESLSCINHAFTCTNTAASSNAPALSISCDNRLDSWPISSSIAPTDELSPLSGFFKASSGNSVAARPKSSPHSPTSGSSSIGWRYLSRLPRPLANLGLACYEAGDVVFACGGQLPSQTAGQTADLISQEVLAYSFIEVIYFSFILRNLTSYFL